MSTYKAVSRRKKHKNSKLGCATCKRRRVKCLENLPACTNCVKHNTRCDYLDYTEKQIESFKKAKAEQSENESARASPHDTSARLEGLSISPGRKDTKDSATSSDNKEFSPAATFAQHEVSNPIRSSPGEFQDASNSGIHISSSNSLVGEGSVESSNSTSSRANPYPDDENTGPFANADNTLADSRVPYRLSSRVSSSDTDSLVIQTGITQDFDNLISNDSSKIIYPIYSFVSSSEPHDASVPVSTLQGINSRMAVDHHSPSAFQFDQYNPKGSHHATYSDIILPNAVQRTFCFRRLSPSGIDYKARFHNIVVELGPLISQGKSNLMQIRDLYHIWLGSQIFSAYDYEIMFSCLLNLTTNYLISSVFRESWARHKFTHSQMDSFRNSLVMHSLNHYANVVKSLRHLLNTNTEPQLSATVSYLLSIMSIYDPYATVNSAICFRNGMFSVLNHMLYSSNAQGSMPPMFTPIHHKLALNLVRTVYFPAYDACFLTEYREMLSRMGSVLSSIEPFDIVHHARFSFVCEVYQALWKFCDETINFYIPTVNNNLENLPLQYEIFFKMFRKWANVGPSKFLTITKHSDPLEQVLCLFLSSFKKAAYSIFPQVKFCYLRDFDSPLILDVFASSHLGKIFFSLDSAENPCITQESYHRILRELKVLSAYATRLITFLSIRLSILYRNVVYNEKVLRIYPIEHTIKWKDTITDIRATRENFQAEVGLRENHIKTFNSTYIKALHYPRIVDDGGEMSPTMDDLYTPSHLDWLSLQPHGLLARDEVPI